MRARIAGIVASFTLSASAFAAEAHLGGRIIDVTAYTGGLMVRLETGVPDNCAGVGYGWMTIPESNKTMIAMALMVWQNESGATVYTDALANGVCRINQFNPWE
jgi:hypothetical protein